MKDEHLALIAHQREIRRYLGDVAIDSFVLLFDHVTTQQSSINLTSEQLYRSLVVQVLRLLFVFYAEGRQLLSKNERSNAEYFSLQEISTELENQPKVELVQRFTVYQRLLSFCKRLYSGDKSLVPCVRNSPMFKPDETLLIDDVCFLTILQKFRYLNDKKIDYKTLQIEHLGSTYERLQDISISVQERQFSIHLSKARTLSGSHYTPSLLCDFLTAETIAPMLREGASSERILSLRICDPAMGTGAFLLSACRYLSDQLKEAWKREGKKNASEFQATRAVVGDCLYGVDINPLAIAVAQLAFCVEIGGEGLCIDDFKTKMKVGNSVLGANHEQAMQFSYSRPLPLEKNLSSQTFSAAHIAKLKAVGDWYVAALWSSYGGVSGKILSRTKRHQFLANQQLLSQHFLHSDALVSNHQIELVSHLPFPVFHWHLEFAEVFSSNGGFDIILGNPPFVNCIRGGLSKAFKECLKERFPLITGSADLSYYFLALSNQIVRDGGRIGLILPRVSLGANALQVFRQHPKSPKPVLIYSANHHHFFDSAAIKVVLYVFGPEAKCKVSNSDVPNGAAWKEAKMDFSNWWPHYQNNWWAFFYLTLTDLSLPQTKGCKRLDQSGFEVSQGLTTADYYNIEVLETATGHGPKLITSGIIEPQQCLWGKKKSRFNGKNYLYPRIAMRDYGSSLNKKIAKSRRPKIIVASLTREVEAYFDQMGLCQASTATLNIFHQSDDVQQLERLCVELHSARSNLLFTVMLSYNAMHSSILMEKSFLQAFPLPRR